MNICKERFRSLLRHGRKNSGPWEEDEICQCHGTEQKWSCEVPTDYDVEFICDAVQALALLQELNYELKTIHLDMGGNHRYAISAKAHPIITRIKHFLSDVQTEKD